MTPAAALVTPALVAQVAPTGGFSTFYLFATALGVGITATLPLVPVAQIGRKFFILMSLVAVVFFSLAVAIGHGGGLYWHLGAAGCLIAYNVFLAPAGGPVSLAVLLVAVACGVGGLVTDAIHYPVEVPVRGPAAAWLSVHLLGSAILLGSALVSMVLGHWYLVARNLSFAILRRLVAVLIAAVVLRMLVVGFTSLAQIDLWQDAWMRGGGAVGFLTSLGLFAGARSLFGLVLPLVLSYMAWRCVRIQSNQSATGILYVVVAFVLMGEMIAKYLLVSSRLLV